MAHRAGKAVMPWGRYKGVRVRLLPDSYLSFLTTIPLMRSPQWKWIWDSVIAELKFRGMREDLAATEEPLVELPVRVPPRTSRKFRMVPRVSEHEVPGL